jgi:hypothetical protein
MSSSGSSSSFIPGPLAGLSLGTIVLLKCAIQYLLEALCHPCHIAPWSTLCYPLQISTADSIYHLSWLCGTPSHPSYNSPIHPYTTSTSLVGCPILKAPCKGIIGYLLAVSLDSAGQCISTPVPQLGLPR